MRITFIGVGHWHATEFYLPALLAQGHEIVSISDPDRATMERVSAEMKLDCPAYTDFRKLLDEVEADFVFAGAPHVDMTEIAAELVERGLPFHMEKPMGVDWRELAPVAAQAESKHLFTSTALVSRYFGVPAKLGELRQSGQLGVPCHYYYRLFAESPDRYREVGCEWMLDPARAGAGPLFNFGPHIIDLFIHLIDEVGEVTARWSHAVHGEEIEDHTSLMMVGRQTGAIGVGEVAYTMPEGYERYFSVTTDRLQVAGEMSEQPIMLRDGSQAATPGVDPSMMYAYYVEDTLRRFEAGEPAIATIADMLPVLRVMNAAVESARDGATVGID